MKKILVALLMVLSVDAEAKDVSLFTERVAPNKIRVYAEPIKYRDENNELHYIDTEFTKNGDDLDNTANVLRSIVKPTGKIVVEHRKEIMTLEPMYIRFNNPAQTTINLSKVRSLSREQRRARISSVAPGVHIEYTALRGRIKENIILESKPSLPPQATLMHIAWAYTFDNPKMTMNILGNHAIVHIDKDPYFIIEPVIGVDAKGRTRSADYSLIKVGGVDFLVATFQTSWFENAEYPLAIDPTISASTVLDSASIGELISITPSYKKWLTKFSLPAIDGDIEEAIFHAECTIGFGLSPISVGAYVSPASWTSADSASTLDAILLGSVNDTVGVVGVGYYQWDVTAGINAAYFTSASTATVILWISTMTGTPTIVFPTFRSVGYQFDGTLRSFAENPYIEITYSGEGGSTAPRRGVVVEGFMY